MHIQRVILIVLDSVGIGSLPDATLYGDEGSNTLGHIVGQIPQLKIPNLISLGLGNVDGIDYLPKNTMAGAAVVRLAEASAGKDTTTGHWELAGAVLEKPFPTFPHGFPAAFIQAFEEKIGRNVIGNVVASGTEIIQKLGDDHVKTGFPIVYTSADSVLQIAAHEDIIRVEQLYAMCAVARTMLAGELEVGRVIARPFTGTSGKYARTSRRKDFAVLPPDTLLDAVHAHGKKVLGIGKINDIFAGKGITKYDSTHNNKEGIARTIDAIRHDDATLIFTNLVDFDMLFGHRRDVAGYGACLEEFDAALPEILSAMRDDDMLVITADHGNDPTWRGTDHTREYVPALHVSSGLKKGSNAGTRKSFADLAATIADALGIEFETKGLSYLSQLSD
jgi:phosphopentomutase